MNNKLTDSGYTKKARQRNNKAWGLFITQKFNDQQDNPEHYQNNKPMIKQNWWTHDKNNQSEYGHD